MSEDEEEQGISWPEFTLPPINLRVLQPALDFYSDESDEWEDEDDAV